MCTFIYLQTRLSSRVQVSFNHIFHRETRNLAYLFPVFIVISFQRFITLASLTPQFFDSHVSVTFTLQASLLPDFLALENLHNVHPIFALSLYFLFCCLECGKGSLVCGVTPVCTRRGSSQFIWFYMKVSVVLMTLLIFPVGCFHTSGTCSEGFYQTLVQHSFIV